MQEQDRKRNSMEANKEVREIYGQDKRVTNNNPERPRGGDVRTFTMCLEFGR